MRVEGVQAFCSGYEEAAFGRNLRAGEQEDTVPIPVYDAATGEAWPAQLFVAVLGASSYTYAEATRDQQLEAWIQAHIHALEFFGGVPTLAVLDNLREGVLVPDIYDPALNPLYRDVLAVRARLG